MTKDERELLRLLGFRAQWPRVPSEFAIEHKLDRAIDAAMIKTFKSEDPAVPWIRSAEELLADLKKLVELLELPYSRPLLYERNEVALRLRDDLCRRFPPED